MARLSDSNRIENLINAIKTLEAEFEAAAPKLDASGIVSSTVTEAKIKFQNDFWESHVKCIDQCNDQFMNLHEKSEINRSTCCETIWDFCCLVNLYNQDILNSQLRTDLELRKLTILLGIEDIKKYCCKELSNLNVVPKVEMQPIPQDPSDECETPTGCSESSIKDLDPKLKC